MPEPGDRRAGSDPGGAPSRGSTPNFDREHLFLDLQRLSDTRPSPEWPVPLQPRSFHRAGSLPVAQFNSNRGFDTRRVTISDVWTHAARASSTSCDSATTARCRPRRSTCLPAPGARATFSGTTPSPTSASMSGRRATSRRPRSTTSTRSRTTSRGSGASQHQVRGRRSGASFRPATFSPARAATSSGRRSMPSCAISSRQRRDPGRRAGLLLAEPAGLSTGTPGQLEGPPAV